MAADTESVRSFIGRTEVVAALHRRFEDARAGAGGVTLLVGDTGVGKSALVEDLVRDIRGHGMTVLIGRALALDDPPPFSLIRSAIESEPDDAAASPGGAAPFGAERILIGFVPGLRGADFPPPVTIEQRLLEALGGTGERVDMSGDRVLTGIADRLLKFTQRGPIALVLEDLHRSDESSLAAIEFLANELQNRPLWILATSRPYASLSESGRARLEAFERATHARRIVLRPMNSGETADYLRLTEPSREFSPSEVARRYSETGGNPLLLEQLDRRTDSTGAVRRPAGTNLPPLDEDAQRTIDVAAVLGSEFPFGLLLRASGEEDEERLTETVDRLVGQGLLIERPGELLAFPDDRLRAAAYARLPERRRRLLHWTAGESLEAMGTGGLSTIYALSRHFYLGQAGKKSVQYNRLAAEIAERALAPEVARDHFSRALESQRTLSSEDHDGESQLVLELARTAEELGHLKEAEEVLRGFLEREKDHTALSARRRATLEIFLARVLADQGDMPGSAELAKKVLASPGLQDQLLVQIGGHHELGLALYYEGQYLGSPRPTHGGDTARPRAREPPPPPARSDLASGQPRHDGSYGASRRGSARSHRREGPFGVRSGIRPSPLVPRGHARRCSVHSGAALGGGRAVRAGDRVRGEGPRPAPDRLGALQDFGARSRGRADRGGGRMRPTGIRYLRSDRGPGRPQHVVEGARSDRDGPGGLRPCRDRPARGAPITAGSPSYARGDRCGLSSRPAFGRPGGPRERTPSRRRARSPKPPDDPTRPRRGLRAPHGRARGEGE